MTDIVATFRNGEDKTHRWQFAEMNTNQSAKQIRMALERLTATKLIDEAGIEIFNTVVAACFVQTEETVLFGTPSKTEQEEKEEDETVQAFEVLLPQETGTQKQTLVEKVDQLVAQYSTGTRLNDFRFDELDDFEEDETEPQTVLSKINK